MRALLLAGMVFLGAMPLAPAQEALTFRAADGVVVYADRYNVGGKRGIVLGFHMAGSNKGEYANVAPRLAEDGFEVIAIDQRSGGALWGRENQTANAFGRDAGYIAALPDLEAALAFAEKQAAGRPIVAMGSSYSASLVFALASKHANVAAVAAFSPGEYFKTLSVKAAAMKVSQPVFVTSSASASEIAAAKTILAASPATEKVQFVPKDGVHGVSILMPTNARGATAAWSAFETFLDKAVPRRS